MKLESKVNLQGATPTTDTRPLVSHHGNGYCFSRESVALVLCVWMWVAIGVASWYTKTVLFTRSRITLPQETPLLEIPAFRVPSLMQRNSKTTVLFSDHGCWQLFSFSCWCHFIIIRLTAFPSFSVSLCQSLSHAHKRSLSLPVRMSKGTRARVCVCICLCFSVRARVCFVLSHRGIRQKLFFMLMKISTLHHLSIIQLKRNSKRKSMSDACVQQRQNSNSK